jgi:hypothetical protein
MADEASRLDRTLLIVTAIIGVIAIMMAFTYITQFLQSLGVALILIANATQHTYVFPSGVGVREK